MRLFHFLKDGSRLFGAWLFLLGAVGGLSGTALIVLINQVISKDPNNDHFYQGLCVAYGVAMVVYFVVQKIYQTLLIRIAQRLIWKVRMSVLDSVRKAALDKLQRIDNAAIYSVLTTDAANISFVSNALATILTSMVTVILSLAYLAWLTITGFLVTFGLMLLIAGIYFVRQKSIYRRMEEARDKEEEFFRYLQHLVYGIKELKMDRGKNDDLFTNHLHPSALAAESLRSSSSIAFVDNGLLGQFYFFAALMLFLFVFPAFHLHLLANTSQYILVTLYVMAPGQAIAQLMPYFSLADVGLQRFARLQRQLSGTGEDHQASGAFDGARFRRIAFNDISYYYDGQADGQAERFGIGPLTLEINRGEVLFVSGANGSGKSTLVRIMTGLYIPAEGDILVDDTRITPDRYQDYRHLFVPVYTDNYVFDRIYGNPSVDHATVNRHLGELGLQSKVHFQDHKFSTITVSEGQKKRLSLAAALVEDKPIFVFDEVAANQDPSFKYYFYHSLVPQLKAKGRTVIVITHDDGYFHLADRHLIMEDGQIKKITA